MARHGAVPVPRRAVLATAPDCVVPVRKLSICADACNDSKHWFIATRVFFSKISLNNSSLTVSRSTTTGSVLPRHFKIIHCFPKLIKFSNKIISTHKKPVLSSKEETTFFFVLSDKFSYASLKYIFLKYYNIHQTQYFYEAPQSLVTDHHVVDLLSLIPK